MTREEAARLLEYHLKNEPTYIGLDDALRMAIAALNEVGSPTTQTDAKQSKNLMSGTWDMRDKTASYTIPKMASNNVVINITGECNWCGPERIGWFSVQFWVRACYGKRKWMSVTQDWKKKVKYCPVCGRKLEVAE